MDNTKLNYFISAAQSLNYSEVARNFYVTQPAVSHQVGLLEAELGVTLFKKHGTKLHLTAEGEFFFPIARNILDGINDAKLHITRFKQGKMGMITVFVTETCRTAFQRCAAVFSRQNPGVLLDTVITSSPTQADILINADYDVCFTLERLVKSSGKFESLYTHQDKLCLVLPRIVMPPETMDDFSFLSDIPFIGLHPANSISLDHDTKLIFDKRDFTPSLTIRYNRMDEVLFSVEVGLGFAILPKSIIDYNPSIHNTSIPLEEGLYCVDYVAAWRREIRNSAAKQFIDIIKKIYL